MKGGKKKRRKYWPGLFKVSFSGGGGQKSTHTFSRASLLAKWWSLA